MSATYFAILTAAGEAKLANATALGVPLKITQMGVGDGNGNQITPSPAQTQLVHEVRKAALNTLFQDPVNSAQIVAEQVIPETEGGWWIRELGLYDETGTLIAVANCPATYKPQLAEGSGRTQVIRMVLIVSSTTAVELKIDPSVVLATRKYVDDSLAAAIEAAINQLDGKQSARVGTTANITLAGLQTIDGILLVTGDRVLVKNQTTAKDNGIYIAAEGTWSRATDADASIEVTPGLFVSVENGTANADSVWQLVTDAPITLGSTALAFEMATGRTGAAAGTYRSITVNARGQVTGGTNPTTLAGYGITDAAPITVVPPGAVIYVVSTTAPPGYLKANGALLSRTTYASLFAAIGTNFGAGDGSTTFALPDLRGEFIRGWDDSRGIDTARTLGSAQGHGVQAHSHSWSHRYFSASGALSSTAITESRGPAYSGSDLGGSALVTGDFGGAETRPRNIALLACIKH